MPSSPDAAAEVLATILRSLGIAKDHLDEVDSIALWSKSDDCSDNRRRRDGLREAGWSISFAGRTLEEAGLPALQPVAAALAELEAMVAPLAEMVTDTMGTHHDLEYRLGQARARAAELLERIGLTQRHRDTEMK